MTSNDKKISLSSFKNIVVNRKLQAWDCVQSNYSFAIAVKNNKKFKQMFPDSKIAQLQTGRWKLNLLYSSELLRFWRNRWLETLNCNHLALSLRNRLQVKWKNNMMVMSSFGPAKKIKLSTDCSTSTRCQIVVNDTSCC